MKDLLFNLYLAGGGVAVGLVLTLLGLLVAWGSKKLKSTKLRALADTAFGVLRAVTKEANGVLIAKLNAARAEDSPGGAKITDEEWADARKAALAKFKLIYGGGNLGKLAAALGLNADALDEYLGSKIAGDLAGPQ